jgi:hypothetical protein
MGAKYLKTLRVLTRTFWLPGGAHNGDSTGAKSYADLSTVNGEVGRLK